MSSSNDYLEALSSLSAREPKGDMSVLETVVSTLDEADLSDFNQQEVFISHLGDLLPRFPLFQSLVIEKLKGMILRLPCVSIQLERARRIFYGIYKLVSLNDFFILLWDWSSLLDWFQAKDAFTLWCVVEIFSAVTRTSESACFKLKQELSKATGLPILNFEKMSFDAGFTSSAVCPDGFPFDCEATSAANLGRFLLPVKSRVPLPDGFQRLVCTPAMTDALNSLAISASAKRPVLLEGPIGCGKSALVQHLAHLTGRCQPPDLIQLQLGGFTDTKALVGVYQTTDIPGEFLWRPGVLCEAMAKGYWLLLEDIYSAPAELGSLLLSVLESRKLVLPGQGTTLKASPGFQLFATHRTGHLGGYRSLQMELLSDHWDIVPMKDLSEEDMAKIIQAKYEKLSGISELLISLYTLLATQSQNSVYIQKRIPSTRDVFKLCQRLASSDNVVVNSVAFFKEIDDCFLCSIGSPEDYLNAAVSVGDSLGFTAEKIHHVCTLSKPVLEVDESYVCVGRYTLLRNADERTRSDESVYALTRHVLVLMERLAACVKFREPALLVGETGTGKTTAIQHLADLLGKKLFVVNMSQQMDSSDLIGGYKPVGMKNMFSEVKDLFFDLFRKSFSLKRNNAFLLHVQNAFIQSNWDILLKLMAHTCRRAVERGTTVDLAHWQSLDSRLVRLEKQMKNESAISLFSFVEGKLVEALRAGSWILLDEINLATSDALESLCGILGDNQKALLLTEKGDLKPVETHPDFRLFACMNPATDVGKKSLPSGIRNRFTEVFVAEPDTEDLKLLVAKYLDLFNLLAKDIEAVVSAVVLLYQELRMLAETKLSDSNGHCPQYSLRTLCRSLTFAGCLKCGSVPLARALFEGFSVSFLSQLDSSSFPVVKQKIIHYLVPHSEQKRLNSPLPRSSQKGRTVCVQGYWLTQGEKEPSIPESYILTESIKFNLKNLARVVCARYPVLLQGPTSVGKTSLIQYLACVTGNVCIRINNHEHTDLQEYIGSYQPDKYGKLVFKEGPLVNAMKCGYWVILDELNLAPTDVLEALNRVLDENRELLINETQEVVKANCGFLLFATQNPPGQYAGRKLLSRAFRNRFVELHFSDIPYDEMGFILHKRCLLPMSHARKMINVMKDLRASRRSSSVFAGKDGLITLRDLFRWGERYKYFQSDANSYDWELHLAADGYFLLAGRVRNSSEEEIIYSAIQKHFSGKLNLDSLFGCSPDLKEMQQLHPLSAEILSKVHSHLLNEKSHLVLTENMRRMFVLIGRALTNKEPVLLIGETGSGKTTACEIVAAMNQLKLFTVNCHMHTEAADFLGGLRPCRHHQVEDEEDFKLFEWHDGPLVQAMQLGDAFLVDEISLADDSVLERLNSVLEIERKLLLAERTWSEAGGEEMEIEAAEEFRIFATMNPGGDFGKKELSAALRNRFTEIWCPSCDSERELLLIIEKSLNPKLLIRPVTEGKSGIGERMIQFLKFWKVNACGKRYTATVRDLLSWVGFVNCLSSKAISISAAYLHGACLVFLDHLETGSSFSLSDDHCNLKKNCFSFLMNQLPDGTMLESSVAVLLDGDKLSENSFTTTDCQFGLGSFSVQRGSEEPSISDAYSFHAPTTFQNAFRLLRALQLNRPVLIEGSPGVGKTSLVTALAKASGNAAVRINLSEETDISDLFGSDLPVEGGKCGEFRWRDGPLLTALKAGHWVVLDELNLASQSVLEGLNACFDHRAEIFVPELGMAFQVQHQKTRIFACQNPVQQGGCRKSLPKSFLDRMTKIFFEELRKEDLLFIARSAFPGIETSRIEKMVDFLFRVPRAIQFSKQTSGSVDINLRDLLRWCNIISKNGGNWNPAQFIELVFASKLDNFNAKQLRVLASDVFGETPSCFYGHLRVTPSTVEVGMAKLKRTGSYVGLHPAYCFLHSLVKPFHALANCLDMGWMAVLVGSSGCGKRTLVRTLAQLTGSHLLEMPMTGDMGIVELLGGFEQEDLNRDAHRMCEAALRLVEEGMECMAKEGIETLGRSKTLITELLCIHCALWKARDEGSVNLEVVWKNAERAVSLIEPSFSKLNDALHSVKKQIEKFKEKAGLLDESNESQSIGGGRGGRFEWIDSFVVQAVKEGHWLLLDNANLCSPSVLDRLNPLLEPGGELKITECGLVDGQIVTVKPHPDFRLILSMDPKYGELSRAVRNRGLEIFVDGDIRITQLDVEALLHSKGILEPKSLQQFTALCDCLYTKESDLGRINLRRLSHFVSIAHELVQRGISVAAAAQSALEKAFNVPLNADSLDLVVDKISDENLGLKTTAFPCSTSAEIALNSEFSMARRDLSLLCYLFTQSRKCNELQIAVQSLVPWFATSDVLDRFLAFSAVLLFAEKSSDVNFEIRLECASNHFKTADTDFLGIFNAVKTSTEDYFHSTDLPNNAPLNCLTVPDVAVHSNLTETCTHSLCQFLLWRTSMKRELLKFSGISSKMPRKDSMMAVSLSLSSDSMSWIRNLSRILCGYNEDISSFLREEPFVSCQTFLEIEMATGWFWKTLSFCCNSSASDIDLTQLSFHWSAFREHCGMVFTLFSASKRLSPIADVDVSKLDAMMGYGRESLSSWWQQYFGSPPPYKQSACIKIIVDLDEWLRYGRGLPSVIRRVSVSGLLASLLWPHDGDNFAESDLVRQAQLILDMRDSSIDAAEDDVRENDVGVLVNSTALLVEARLIALLTCFIRGFDGNWLNPSKELVVLLSTLLDSQASVHPFTSAVILRLQQLLAKDELDDDLLSKLFGEIRLSFHDRLYFFRESWASTEWLKADRLYRDTSTVRDESFLPTFPAIESQSAFMFCFIKCLDETPSKYFPSVNCTLASVDLACRRLTFLANHFWSNSHVLDSPALSMRQSLWITAASDFTGLIGSLGGVPLSCHQKFENLLMSAEVILKERTSVWVKELASLFVQLSKRRTVGSLQLPDELWPFMSSLLDSFLKVFTREIFHDILEASSELGKVTALLGVMQLSLVLPDNQIDSVEKDIWELHQTEADVVAVETELAIRHAQDAFLTGRSSFPVLDQTVDFQGFELSECPQMEIILLAKHRLLSEQVRDLRKKAACRPEKSQFTSLVGEMKQFSKTLGSPEKVLSLVNRLESLFSAQMVSQKSLVEEAVLWRKSAEQFIHYLQQAYPLYRDLTVPFVSGISQAIQGLEILCASVQKNRGKILLKSVKSLGVLGYKEDVLSTASGLADQAFKGLKEFTVTANLQSRLVQFILKLFSVGFQQKGWSDPTAFSSFNNLLDACCSAWKEQQSSDFIKAAADAEHFRYRLKSNITEKDETIPEYNDFTDLLQEEPLLEEKPIKKASSFEGESREDVPFELYDVHRVIYCSLASSQWLWRSSQTSTLDCQCLSVLFQRRYELLSCLGSYLQGFSVDGELAPAHSLFATLKCRNYASELPVHKDLHDGLNSRKFYDIYRDSNFSAVLSVLPVLQSFVDRVKELLAIHPDNPVLIQLLNIIERIKSFSFISPVMKFLTGVELLLEKAQAWENYADRRLGLSSEIKAALQLMAKWKKMELSSWPQLLETISCKFSKRASLWWYHLHPFVVSLSNDSEQTVSAVQHFLESSSVGEFQSRLDLVYAFHCELVVKNDFSSACNILYHLYRYYKQFLESVLSGVQAKRLPIEKEIKDFIKLFKWNETNFLTLKESAAKAQDKLRHCARSFENVLSEPVEKTLCVQSLGKQESVLTLGSNMEMSRRSFRAYFTELSYEDAFSSFARFHIKRFRNKEAILKLPMAVKKMKQSCLTLLERTQETDFQEIDVFECVAALKTLQSSDEQIETKSALKVHARKKRVALTSLFRSLKSIGLSYHKGIQLRKEGLSQNPFLLQPVDMTAFVERAKSLSRGLLNNEALETAMIKSWSATSVMYYQCLSRDKALLGSAVTPSKELVALDVERMNGFTGQLLAVLNLQLKMLGKAAEQMASISDRLGSLSSVKSWCDSRISSSALSLPLQKDTLQWMMKLKNLLEDAEFKLGEVFLLFTSFPLPAGEKPDDVVRPAYARSKNADLVEKQKNKIDAIKGEYFQRKSLLDKMILPILAIHSSTSPVLISWQQYEQMNELFTETQASCDALNAILDSLQGDVPINGNGGLLAPLANFRFHVLSVCEEYFSWSTQSQLIGESTIEETDLTKLQDETLELSKVVTGMVPCLEQSRFQQEENDDYFDSLPDGQIFSALGKLELPKVGSMFSKIIFALSSWGNSSLTDDSRDILCSGVAVASSLLPLINVYWNYSFWVLTQAVIFHGSSCSLFCGMTDAFSDLLCKGYGCTLDSDGDDAERATEDAKDLDGGSLPGEGDGAQMQNDFDQTENQDIKADATDKEACGDGMDSLGEGMEGVELGSDEDDRDEDADAADNEDVGGDNSDVDNDDVKDEKFGETEEGAESFGSEAACGSDVDSEDNGDKMAETELPEATMDEMPPEAMEEIDSTSQKEQFDASLPQANQESQSDSSQEEEENFEMSSPQFKEDLDMDDGSEDAADAEDFSTDNDIPLEGSEDEECSAKEDNQEAEAPSENDSTEMHPSEGLEEKEENLPETCTASNQTQEDSTGGGSREDLETGKQDAPRDEQTNYSEKDKSGVEENDAATSSYSVPKKSKADADASAHDKHLMKRVKEASLAEESEPNPKRLKMAPDDEKVADQAKDKEEHLKSDEYMHLPEGSEKHDNVALAAATEQQAVEKMVQMDDDALGKEEDQHETQRDENEPAIVSLNDGTQEFADDEVSSAEPVTEEEQMLSEKMDGVDDRTTDGRAGEVSLVQFRHNFDWTDSAPTAAALREQLEAYLTSSPYKTSFQSFSDAQTLWRKYEQLTSDHARDLCEQLRLVLEPTLSTRLRGDYRSGKRLNMKKIIPYIASGFRRDKIWLRRTKPSKRQYQVMLAMDDSSSMGGSHCKQMAFEALSIVSNALRWLEVGQFGICSFGENTNVVQSFIDPFSNESGGRILQEFTFDQSKTRVAQMVNTCVAEMLKFESQIDRNQTRSRLLLIVSDGRGIFLEGTEVVKTAVRRAQNAGVVVVFIILDSLRNKDSVLDIVVPFFDDKMKAPRMLSYMDEFPFPFYILLKDVSDLPRTLSDALRQWFEYTASGEH